jgi:hypothetical protein
MSSYDSRLQSSDHTQLNTFIAHIFPHVEKVYHSSSENETWKDIWKTWTSNGINSLLHMKRSNMSILIQGPNVPGKPKLDCEIYHIIKSIQELYIYQKYTSDSKSYFQVVCI